MAASVFLIKRTHLNHDAARAAEKPAGDEAFEPTGTGKLLKDKRVLIFSAAIVLFYCANAATLPLVGQILTAGHNPRSSAWQISAAVMVAEGVMIGVAAYSGRLADRFGRKPLFLIAFTALAIRNALTVVNHNRYYLIGLQAFDGIAAAIYGVLLTLVSADLARGTGRFNFLRSTVQSAMGLGGFVSNTAFGYVAKSFGFNAAFWGLAAVAASGGLLYQAKMPETRARAEQEHHEAAPAPTPA
jgi:MFS family permease